LKKAWIILVILLTLLIPKHVAVFGAGSQSLMSMKQTNPATLWVYLPDGHRVGSNPDIWLHKGWVMYQSGNTWTFTLKIKQQSHCLSSFDTHLIIALNDEAYNNLIDLVVDGISVPSLAFKFGRPHLYGIEWWPNDVYPTWFNDTLVNLGTIHPKQVKEIVVRVTFSDPTNAKIHFDAYGKTVPFDPPCPGFITRNPNGRDSTVLWKYVPQPPEAEFTWVPPYPCVNQTVTFNASESSPNGGEITSYRWDFGDGNITITNQTIITHIYYDIGTYAVTLNVTDSEGLWDTETKNITVVTTPTVSIQPPETIWTYETRSIGENLTIDVYVNNVTNLWAWKLGLTFNASVLQCLEVSEGSFLKSGGNTTWTPGVINNTIGVISPFECSLLEGGTPVSGSGVLASILFTTINYGNSSLHPINVTLYDSGMSVIPVNVFDGHFAFIPPPPFGPTAFFTYSPVAPYANQPVTFNASESEPGWTGWEPAPIVSYEWDFGDGNITITNEPTIIHIYSTMDVYNVTLTVTDSEGRTDSYLRTLIVDAIAPNAYFEWDPFYPIYGETVTFNASLSTPDGGELISYEWNFGDGNTDSGVVVTHIFQAGGTYNVTLTVTDSEGKSDTTWRLISVLTEIYTTPPAYAASYLGEEFSIEIKVENVTNLYSFEFKLGYNTTLLDATDIEEGLFLSSFGNTIIEKMEINDTVGYVWVSISLEPSSPAANGSGVLAFISFNVTFATEWPESVSCVLDLYDTILTDVNGYNILHESQDGLYIFVPPIVPPTAAFSYSPEYPLVNETVTFNASESSPNGGEITSYRWDFGDGNITEVNVSIITHSYSLSNIYNVTLTVFDNQGLNDTTWAIVKVYLNPESPSPDFNWIPVSPVKGEIVTFNASTSQPGFDGTNTCPIAWYYWDFGDGTAPINTTDPVITHTFSSAGTYDVNLTVYAPPSSEAHPSYYPYGITIKQITVTVQTYTLTIATTSGGTTDPPPGNYTYDEGTVVSVTALPEANYQFDYWELDGVFYSNQSTVEVVMDSDHELKAFFKYLPPLSVSISPTSVTIYLGDSVTFTSSTSGGVPPYSYQWYLNNAPVSGANQTSWTFTPTASGIYYIYLKVTDSNNNIAQSETAKVTVISIPVGGYAVSVSLTEKTSVAPLTTAYILLIISFSILLSLTKRKRK